jgi:hypothetical protein
MILSFVVGFILGTSAGVCIFGILIANKFNDTPK